MKLKRFLPFIGIFSAIIIAGFLYAHPTFAAALSGDQLFGGATAAPAAGTGAGFNFATAAGLGAMQTLPQLIAAIIRVILGFLGIIAVVFVLYGGFTYMTSGGDPERVKKAKRILTNAAIGLVIVLSSFAIAQFVVSKLSSASVSGGGDGGGGGGCVGLNCDNNNDKPLKAFTLTGVNTKFCSEVLQNFSLQFKFSQAIKSKLGIHVFKGNVEVVGDYNISNNGKKVTFIPTQTCSVPNSNPEKKVPCFLVGDDYKYVVDPSALVSTSGGPLVSCANPPQGAPLCTDTFKIGSGIDLKPPTAEFTDPKLGASLFVGKPGGNHFQTKALDDTGIGNVDFFANDPLMAIYSANGPGEKLPAPDVNYLFKTDAAGEWDPDPTLVTNKSYEVWAVANDCAGNSTTTKKVSVVLRAATCNDAAINAGETALNCGGDSKSVSYCGACQPLACKVNADCSSGMCANGSCIDLPVIQSVSPDNGAIGNLITIKGTGFGKNPGSVYFLGSKAEEIVPTNAYSCGGKDLKWSDHEIIVQIPVNAVDGPLQVNVPGVPEVVGNPNAKPPVLGKEAIPPRLDRTNDENGPVMASGFDVNKMQRPGLCSIGDKDGKAIVGADGKVLNPPSSSVNAKITFGGLSFGAAEGSSRIWFSNFLAPSPADAWGVTSIKATVPSVKTGSYDTQIFVGDALCLDKSNVPIKDANNALIKCASDLDCKTKDGETCGSARCSEVATVKYCKSNVSCGVGEGTCMDIRSGSNTLQFDAINNPTGAKPVIISVDPIAKKCAYPGLAGMDPTLNGVADACSSDNDCKTKNVSNVDYKGVCKEYKNSGGPGQYITIYGSGFGTSSIGGSVKFTGTNGFALGDFTFPKVCQNNAWQDDRILVKVPQNYNDQVVDGKPVGLTNSDYNLTVTISGEISNAIVFHIFPQVIAGPSICLMKPNAGPIGTDVTFTGEKIGTMKGTVTFNLNLVLSPSDWTTPADITLGSTILLGGAGVPVGAKTGPVFITNSSSQRSNSLSFAVGNCNEDKNLCKEGSEQCCKGNGTCIANTDTCDVQAKSSQYAYKVSTSPIPIAPTLIYHCDQEKGTAPISPTPWEQKSPGGVCPDSEVKATFSLDMDPTTLNGTNIFVQKCSVMDANGTDCKTWDPQHVAGNVTHGTKDFAFSSASNPKFDPNSYYQVTVKGKALGNVGVKSLGGAFMVQDTIWKFKTLGVGVNCTVGQVNVNPLEYTATVPGKKIDYLAELVSSEDKCVVLACSGHTLGWSLNVTKDKAELTTALPATTSGNNACVNSVLPITETKEGQPVVVTATEQAQNKSGKANLDVHFAPLQVTDYFPTCQSACINVLPKVTFNYPIQYMFNTGTVKIFKCQSAVCDVNQLVTVPNFFATFNLDKTTNTYSLVFPVNTKLDPNTYYRAIIGGELETSWLIPLSKGGSNYKKVVDGKVPNDFYPNAFSWIFKTRNDATDCKPDRVGVSPKVAVLNAVGEKQEFSATAFSAKDECSDVGQSLQPGSLGWVWNAWTAMDNPNINAGSALSGVDAQVVAMNQNSFGSNSGIVLAKTLPAYCSGNCLNAGSTIKIGQSICGKNGKENGESCDDGNLKSGDGCSSSCLLEGSILATCGNGVIDANEECDDSKKDKDGKKIGGGGCSNVCLLEGSINTPNAICGNGTLDQTKAVGGIIVTGGESCEDGNKTNGDGCSSNCTVEGSLSVSNPTVCGNGSKETGESCDPQGWTTTCDDGTACTVGGAKCVDKSLCQLHPKDGCSVQCLNQGTIVCTANGQNNCCGNNKTEFGEDDDQGSGKHDGLSSSCLKLGSSAYYAIPSYCGDGISTGTGEQCDASIGFSNPASVGGYSVQKIASGAPLEVESDKTKPTYGYAISQVKASAGSVTGTADLKLQCSCTDDTSCGNTAALGCGLSNCCYARPTIVGTLPISDAKDLCRNTAIDIQFSEDMDSASFKSIDINKDGTISQDEYNPNIKLELTKIGGAAVIAREKGKAAIATTCPIEYVEWQTVFNSDTKSTSNLLVKAWNFLKQFVSGLFGKPVSASDTYKCLVPITFETLPDHHVAIHYDSALVINGTYQLTVGHDVDGSNNIVEGVYSKYHVGIYPNVPAKSSVTFTTGDKICLLNVVALTDTGKTGVLQDYESKSKGYYSKKDESHNFEVKAQSYKGNAIYETITPVSGYSWSWTWGSSDQTNDILNTSAVLPNITTFTGTATGKNGTENVLASAKIETDTISNPSTKDQTKSAAVSETAFLCSNPWPSQPATVPYIESDAKSNFSFFYCRDRGDENRCVGGDKDKSACQSNNDCKGKTDATNGTCGSYTTDDLPGLTLFKAAAIVNPDPLFVKELVFNVDNSKDAIGMRVYHNPKYLTPLAWFQEQKGFQGTPNPTKLDGYDAVQTGTTIYAGAGNLNAGVVDSNIYVISYNPDAGADAKTIFGKILQNFRLNASACAANGTGCVTDLHLCTENKTSLIKNSKDQFVGCSLDSDCLESCQKGFCAISGKTCNATTPCATQTSSPFCDANKTKLQRDMKRLTDIVQMQSTIDAYGDKHKHCSISKNQSCNSNADCSGSEKCVNGYPTISTGTFIPSMSNSLWPSWQSALGNAIGSALPKDPLNTFFKQCTDPTNTGDASKNKNYDPASCWNGAEGKFVCPEQSHVYAYQNLGGEKYSLYAQLEYTKAPWSSPIDVSGGDDATIQAYYYPGVAPEIATQFGFTTNPGAFACTDSVLGGGNGICGDGIKSTGNADLTKNELCEKGEVQSVPCAIQIDGAGPVAFGRCQNFVGKDLGKSCTAKVDCLDLGVSCKGAVAGNQNSGKCFQNTTDMQKACSVNVDCLTSGVKCQGTSNGQCYDTVQKKYLSNSVPCDGTDAAVPNKNVVCGANQICVNGMVNTTCDNTCKAFLSVADAIKNGAQCKPLVCGNSIVDPGESCDDGVLNGTYGHCGKGCVASTNYCGDGYLSGGEQCDCGSVAHASVLGNDPQLYDDTWASKNCRTQSSYIVPNGVYDEEGIENGCSSECKKPGPMCGDKIVNGPEQCDGNAAETYAGKFCQDAIHTMCVTNEDCPKVNFQAGVCGDSTPLNDGVDMQSCGSGTICISGSDIGKKCGGDTDCAKDNADVCIQNKCSVSGQSCTKDSECVGRCSSPHCVKGKNDGLACTKATEAKDCIVPGYVAGTCGAAKEYPLTRTRSCLTSGIACTWENWGECRGGSQNCGDGAVTGTEECDNGKSNSDNGACTKQCKKNVCGDGNVYAGIESCDGGANNGNSCIATHGNTCNYCNKLCQYKTQSGGYCGDGERNGNESCDATDISYVCFKSFEYTPTEGPNKGITLQGATLGANCSKYGELGDGSKNTQCPKDYTCRFVGSCNGGSSYKENGQPCTLTPGTLVPFGSTGKGDLSANMCQSGTCTPPVCAQDCGSSCPTTYKSTAIQVQSATPGATPVESLKLSAGTSFQSQGTLLLPACSVGTNLYAQFESTDPNSVATIDISSPILTFTPSGTGKTIDVVFMIDLEMNLDQTDENGVDKMLKHVKDFMGSNSGILKNLNDVASTSTSQKVNVGLVGFYYDNDSKKQVLINMAEGTVYDPGAFIDPDKTKIDVTKSFYDLKDNYAKLSLAIADMIPSESGSSSFAPVFQYARDLLEAEKTKDASKFAVLISLDAPSKDKNGVDCTDEIDPNVIGTGYISGKDSCSKEIREVIQKVPLPVPSVMYDAYSYYLNGLGKDFRNWIAQSVTPPGIATSFYDPLDYQVRSDALVIQLFGGQANVPDKTPSTVTIDSSENVMDIPLPQSFVCTGKPMYMSFSVSNLNSDGSEKITIKNPTFTYCPAK